MKLKKIALVAGLLLVSASAQAEWWGTLSGRSANPANNPQLSVEGSLTTSGDYQNIGARLNYTTNEALTVYGDFGISDYAGDGNSFGVGFFYYLPELTETMAFMGDVDVAVQGSYHTASLGIDVGALTTALLVSPKTAINPDNGMNWYANVGFTRLSFDYPNDNLNRRGSSSSFELQLGGGVYMPMGPGTLYAGIDLLDELIFGIGYRYGLN